MANKDIERDGARNHILNDSSSINSIPGPSEETSLMSSNTKKDDYQSTDVSIGDSSSTEDEAPQEFRSPVGIIALLLIGNLITSA